MPPRGVKSAKRKRQYEHIKESQRGNPRAEEIAARTVNKQRRSEGRTPNRSTQGSGNPNTRYEDRSVDELQNIAAEMNIRSRSKMRKSELIDAIRDRR